MEIDPDDPKLIPFYKKMAELNLPLLSHTGKENSFSRADEEFGDPEKLRLPLSLGVTVIAAHIASSEKYHGERGPDRLARLMREYPNLYTDISALTQINRPGCLKEALTKPEFSGRLVYGTDFPLINTALVSPWYSFPAVAPSEMVDLADQKPVGPGRFDETRPGRAGGNFRPPGGPAPSRPMTQARSGYSCRGGMGEPLLNFDNIVAAMRLMMDDFAYGLSKRRVTISTSGVVPAMYRLTQECDVSMAVSLHAANDALRDEIVPINKKYPLKELLAACLVYTENSPRHFITFEYVMLAGINDALEDARALVKLLKNVPCKMNLIPFNPFPNSGYKCSSSSAIDRFRTVLHHAGLVTTVRRTRGDDIDAACGQLVGQVQDKSKRTLKLQHARLLHVEARA